MYKFFVKYHDACHLCWYIGIHLRTPVIILIFPALLILVCVKYYYTDPYVSDCSARVRNNIKLDTNGSQLECTYEDDITIYMDAFQKVKHYFFGDQYEDFY